MEGRLKTTELTIRGRISDMQSAPQTLHHSVSQQRCGENTASEQRAYSIYVPVVDLKDNPLMPTIPSRAKRWIRGNQATPFWKKGIFCVRLSRLPSAQEKQEIVIGVDPGSKKEAFTIKSDGHTFLNIQADAVQHVKDAVEVRRNMRRSRRFRKTPCRANRYNRKKGKLAPSTKARWQWKLNIIMQLSKLFPITHIVVEDIKARTVSGKNRWNTSFSPLEVGKKWFYDKLKKIGKLSLKQGYDTKKLRDDAGLSKTKNKLSEVFEAHCVDSWVLANWKVGGHIEPDNYKIMFISPIRLHRRQLHALQSAKKGIRRDYGSTRSCGFKRGSLVKHPKYGLTYVGGCSKDKISLHSIVDGKRLSQNIDQKDTKLISYNIWKSH